MVNTSAGHVVPMMMLSPAPYTFAVLYIVYGVLLAVFSCTRIFDQLFVYGVLVLVYGVPFVCKQPHVEQI